MKKDVDKNFKKVSKNISKFVGSETKEEKEDRHLINLMNYWAIETRIEDKIYAITKDISSRREMGSVAYERGQLNILYDLKDFIDLQRNTNDE